MRVAIEENEEDTDFGDIEIKMSESHALSIAIGTPVVPLSVAESLADFWLHLYIHNKIKANFQRRKY